MKRTTTTAILLVIAASLAFAGSALAGSKTIKQTGRIVGDQATFVKLRVKVKNGEPQKISGYSAKDVLTRCEGKKGRVNKRYSYSALNPISVNSSNQFNAVLVDDSIGLKIKLQGKVKRRGKAVTGTIKTNRFDLKNQVCKVPGQKFKTAK
jgi:archaellin